MWSSLNFFYLVPIASLFPKMSDHELTEDDHEINVLDTDSRLSNSDSEPHSARSHCSSPETAPNSHSSTSTTLPFSISNLLGKHFDDKSESEGPEITNQLSFHPHGIHHQRNGLGGFIPSGYYGQGVLRVPAHRPLGGPGSPGAVFNPWTLGLDPVLQRSAAAAAFASQVVKDRLAGKLTDSDTFPNFR